MATEKKEKKRKAAASSGAVDVDTPSKKSKKSSVKPVKAATESRTRVPKSGKASDDVNGSVSKPLKVDSTPTRDIKPRKRAADFLSDDEADATKLSKKGTKSSKKVTDEIVKPVKKKAKEEPASTSLVTSKKPSSKDKKVKESKELAKAVVETSPEEDEQEDEGDDAEFLRGFESSGEEDASGDEGFAHGQEVPQIPDSKQVKRKIRSMKKHHPDEKDEPGVVYLGRIPHGFYEHEMRAYFSQFGDITRLRMARNRTTGRSKHYAFIEFSSVAVAKIVADTMHNYLMFGHILKCEYRPQDSVHPEIWKGANRRFKKVPWNQIEKQQLDAGKTREQWSKKIGKEESKRAAKAEKMKALGYEIDLPKLTSVDVVPVQKTLAEAEEPAIQNIADETPKALEAPPKKGEEEVPIKEKSKSSGKKAKKTKDSAESSTKTLAKAEEPAIQNIADETPKALEVPPENGEKEVYVKEKPKSSSKKGKKTKDAAESSAKTADVPKEENAALEKPAKLKKGDSDKKSATSKEGKVEKKSKAKTPATVKDDSAAPSKEPKAKESKEKEPKRKVNKGESGEKKKKKAKA
ncbi:nucleolar protein [Ophidiomyces ophidiicola]|nr:nucleolar protein [Ophidiomyces ophidiicola]KAI1987292.1 nucleolar protein [Ophidiomyces ophidiicola]KAI1990014.1 nucleolar protein [Ophidiomyces ophidiicola]KAI1990218.1 nucleolar protein [Ophidiomyces ophidiicola]